MEVKRTTVVAGWVSHQFFIQPSRYSLVSGYMGSICIRCSLSQLLVVWLYMEISSQIR